MKAASGRSCFVEETVLSKRNEKCGGRNHFDNAAFLDSYPQLSVAEENSLWKIGMEIIQSIVRLMGS